MPGRRGGTPRLVSLLASLAACTLLAACQVPGPTGAASGIPTGTPAAPATSRPTAPAAGSHTPLEAAQAALDDLLRQLEQIHPEPFHGIAREAFVAELMELRAALATLSPEAALVGLQRLVALLSRNGRDGHQIALPAAGSEGQVLPIRVYEFDDGLFITDAFADGQQSLVGARVEALNGHPIDEVLAAVEPLVPRDGPATVPLFRPVLLLRTETLRGLGLVEAGDVAIEVTRPDGSRGQAVLEPIAFAEYQAWAGVFGMFRLPERPGVAYLSDLETVFYWRVLDDGETAYLRYTQLQRFDGRILDQITERIGRDGLDRVVLDIRQNPGGDNHNIPTLLDFLRQPAVDRPGRLFVLTDHVTFSAAANLATQVEQATSARFAGQPMGGGLNFWDDVRFIQLPDYPIPARVGISTRYWEFAPPDDPRLTIDPGIVVASRSSDYFGDRDPVLEAVLAATP